MPAATDPNPLLETSELPPFSAIKPDHVEPAITAILAENRAQIGAIEQLNNPDWDSLVTALDELNDRLNQAWSPVSHMNSVVNSDALRDAYNACLPLLSDYSTELGQSRALFEAYQALADTDLDAVQTKVVEDALRDFRLAGVALPPAQQQQYGELKKRLSELGSKFSENVLDATNAWHKHVTDPAELTGIPDSALQAMADAAQAEGKDGYWLTLDIPCYLAVTTYGDNAALREEMYQAYVTRASDQGPHAGQWDNSQLIDETLALRHQLAELLGFADYAELSLATKMADSSQQVVDFLEQLAERSVEQARLEFKELQAFAQENGGVDTLSPWDVGYFSEKLRQHRYAISQEELRPYFPLDKVLTGLFEIAQRLYGITITEQTEFDSWHDEAQHFVVAKAGKPIARFYLDVYARSKKRGGAWMDECRVRRRTASGALQLPVAYLVCNFNRPTGDQPALLTHNEVTTLFHEFGHGLHHMLTEIEYAAVSGINGVAWDAVELPSQFMENWCWEKDGLALISGHHETGDTLPDDLLDKLLAAKNFQSAMQMVRQLEFALFDMRIHQQYQPGLNVQQVLDDVRAKVAVVPVVDYNRFQHGFSHIFAGGYAAGYYSYKWAEVLSADAFSRFEEEGIFSPEAGASFLQNILQKGGSQDAAKLFAAFRGREPSVDALLRHSGLAA